jgi:hypothetical protein
LRWVLGIQRRKNLELCGKVEQLLNRWLNGVFKDEFFQQFKNAKRRISAF